jgi:hypothetical protein
LTNVIVNKDIVINNTIFNADGESMTACVDILIIDGKTLTTHPGSSGNALLTNRVFEYSDLLKDDCINDWKYENGEIVKSFARNHTFVDGLCKNCGLHQTVGITYTYSEADGGYVVTGYTGSSTEVYIAKEYNNIPVVAIGRGAFGSNSYITKVVAPKSVKKVGGSAFEVCASLTYVALPGWTENDYYETINGKTEHNNQFLFNGNLTTVILGDSFTSNTQIFVASGEQTAKQLDIYLTSANGSFVSGDNAGLLSGKVYYYSETEPVDTAKTYWRFVNGEVDIW